MSDLLTDQTRESPPKVAISLTPLEERKLDCADRHQVDGSTPSFWWRFNRFISSSYSKSEIARSPLTIALAPTPSQNPPPATSNVSTRTLPKMRAPRPRSKPRAGVGFIEDATRHLGNVRVDTFDVLIVDYARKVGATAIVKGLRAISDFEYELEMNQLNRHLADDIESVYLMASPQYSFLSSSGVKEIATFGGDVSDLVGDEVARP